MGLASRSLLEHAKQAVCKTNLIFLCRKIGAGVCGLFSVVFLAVFLPVYFLVIKKSDPSSGGPYKREAVATDTQQCSEIGKEILNANGSAVDAAIAAMFCLGVISMHSSGIGGGGVMLVYNRSLQEASVIDFRETAPARAHRDMFKGKENEAQKGILFRFVFCKDVSFKKQGNNITRTRETWENGRIVQCCGHWV